MGFFLWFLTNADGISGVSLENPLPSVSTNNPKTLAMAWVFNFHTRFLSEPDRLLQSRPDVLSERENHDQKIPAFDPCRRATLYRSADDLPLFP